MDQAKIGQSVWYYPVIGLEDTRVPAVVNSEPWALGHGEMVVKLEGRTGCFAVRDLEERSDE